MNRRDTLRVLPLSLAGIAGMARESLGQVACGMGMMTPPVCQNSVKPGEALNLYDRYAKNVCDRLNWMRDNQYDNLRKAADAIARTVLRGSRCWSAWDTGHSTINDQYSDRPGMPEIIDSGWDAKAAKPGDLLLANRWRGPYEVVREKNIFVIGGPAPVGGDAKGQDLIIRPEVSKGKIRPHANIWIENNITTMGPELYLPGEPAPFGALSGILGQTEYWMMVSEACRILSREGYKGTVQGDEPALSEKTAWTKLDTPLMDSYFSTLMIQLAMIKGEMGAIRQAASAVTDVVLNRGSVYYYSREHWGPASEAVERRGGLVFNKGDWEGNIDFAGTAKDIAVMVIDRPDCPVDRKHYDAYRAAGMKVISIGPNTRDGKIPAGPTIPKDSDLHLCCIPDTYGIFAVPGFARKVCPTSGPLVNQTYWALQMEVVEDIIRRTGNVPGVYMSYSVRGNVEHNASMLRRFAERGY